MSFNTQIRLFQLFVQVMGIVGIGYLFYSQEYTLNLAILMY